jgi:hypothetical protein
MSPAKLVYAVLVSLLCSLPVACAPADRQGREGGDRQFGVVDGIDYVARSDAPTGSSHGATISYETRAGRTVTTVTGTMGGPFVANEAQKRSRRPDEDYRVGIRVDDGSYRTIVTRDDPGLHPGDRVFVAGDRISW